MVNGFHCKRNTESINFTQSQLEQCASNDGQVVCMHSFKFGGEQKREEDGPMQRIALFQAMYLNSQKLCHTHLRMA